MRKPISRSRLYVQLLLQIDCARKIAAALRAVGVTVDPEPERWFE